MLCVKIRKQSDRIKITFPGKERTPYRSFHERTPGGKASKLFQPNGNLLLRGCVRGRPGLLIGPSVFWRKNVFRRLPQKNN